MVKLNSPLASIVIVNYNGDKFLDNLFRSLSNQTFKNFEVIFVDNASKDRSMHLVKKYLSSFQMQVIKNTENVGFCLANNLGFQLSRGEYVVFLNNDTFVDSNWLKRMIEKAEENREIGAVVCSILYPCSHRVLEGPMAYDVYGATLGPANDRFFYGTGASLLVKKDLLRKIGVFDPKLFMYQDDVDLCWRIRLCGYEIVYEPRAVCYHVKDLEGVIEKNLMMPVWKFYHGHCKNRIRVLVKNYGKANLIKRMSIVIFLVASRSVLLSFMNKNPRYFSAFVKGILWNLHNLRNTLMERSKIQKIRKKTDSEIEAHMLRYPVEFLFI